MNDSPTPSPVASSISAVSKTFGVLVTFRRPGDLERTLAALARQSRLLDELVVVDNGPAGEAEGAVRRWSASVPTLVDYMAMGENLGPAGGLASGIEHVLDRAEDDDWIILLDDDDPPRLDDAFEHLVGFAERLRAQHRVGAVGMAGAVLDRRRARFLPLSESDLTREVSVHYIGGNQLPTLSVRAIRDVGVFDPRLFFGFDDFEYGQRLRSRGWQLFCDGAYVRRERDSAGTRGYQASHHRGLAPATWRDYYGRRNLARVLIDSGESAVALRVVARSFARPLANLGREPGLARDHLLVSGRALFDALTNRMGRTVEPD